MSKVAIFYRRINGRIFGSLQVAEGSENQAVEVLDNAFKRWCDRTCDTAHGLPVFTNIPFLVRGQRVIRYMKTALRKAGFEAQFKKLR